MLNRTRNAAKYRYWKIVIIRHFPYVRSRPSVLSVESAESYTQPISESESEQYTTTPETLNGKTSL